MSVMLCTGSTFVKKDSCLVARIAPFDTIGLHLLTFRILEQYPSDNIALDLSHVIQINGIVIVHFKSYLNQCFYVSQLLKYDGNIVVKYVFQNFLVRLKFSIRQAMKIKLSVAREIQYFELGIFSFNSYVYYLTRGFSASTRVFNLPSCAFNLPTRAFNLATRAFILLTCAFRLVTHEFELVTRGFELVTRGFELLILEVELVTRVLLFHKGLTASVCKSDKMH